MLIEENLIYNSRKQSGNYSAGEKSPTLEQAMGNGGGNRPLIIDSLPKTYAITAEASNSMNSGNPDSGIYQTEISKTIDTSGINPTRKQGGMMVVEPVYSLQGSMIGREQHNGPQGSGINENVCFSENTVDRHAVAYTATCENSPDNDTSFHADVMRLNCGSRAEVNTNVTNPLAAREYKQPQITCITSNSTSHPAFGVDCCVTLQHHDVTTPPVQAQATVSAVRYITPCECAALQGFPKGYASHTATENPTDEDMAFWRTVFDDYCRINGIKPKTDSQIRKWLKNPHTDSAEYKMWGNGMAKPCIDFVLESILNQLESEEQS